MIKGTKVYRMYVSSHDGEDTEAIYDTREKAQAAADEYNNLADLDWFEAYVDEWVIK